MVKWLVNSRRLPLIASEMREEFLFEKWLSFGILGRKRHGAVHVRPYRWCSRYLVRSAIPVKDAKHFTTNQSRSSRSNFDYSRPVYAKLVVNPIEIYIKTEDNTRKENSRGYSNLFEFIGIFHSFKLIRED